jgi:hypothetical protein
MARLTNFLGQTQALQQLESLITLGILEDLASFSAANNSDCD